MGKSLQYACLAALGALLIAGAFGFLLERGSNAAVAHAGDNYRQNAEFSRQLAIQRETQKHQEAPTITLSMDGYLVTGKVITLPTGERVFVCLRRSDGGPHALLLPPLPEKTVK